MGDDDAGELSAQVILSPADPSAAAGPITSANLAQHAPSQRASAALQEWFRSTGFDVGPLVGISFSISGPMPLFRSVFGDDQVAGAVQAAKGGEGSLELDPRPIREDLRDHLLSVSFSLPPEFGPGAP